MQRSIFNKNIIIAFSYVFAFIIYTALSSVYLFLPPLLSILFVLFSKAIKKENILHIFLIIFCLIFFESANDYLLLSTIVYFSIIYKYVIPKIVQNTNCNLCIKIAIVLLVYIGFFIFNLISANIFMLPMPSINHYVIYYIMIEFLIVSIL
jgi:hypothetical protein